MPLKGINDLNITELKSELKLRDINVIGIRPTLIARLKKALLDEGIDPEICDFAPPISIPESPEIKNVNGGNEQLDSECQSDNDVCIIDDPLSSTQNKSKNSDAADSLKKTSETVTLLDGADNTAAACSTSKLWVSNISSEVRAANLSTLLSRYVQVANCKIVSKPPSKGHGTAIRFGLLELLSTTEHVKKIIETLQGTLLLGQEITLGFKPVFAASKTSSTKVTTPSKSAADTSSDHRRNEDGKKSSSGTDKYKRMGEYHRDVHRRQRTDAGYLRQDKYKIRLEREKIEKEKQNLKHPDGADFTSKDERRPPSSDSRRNRDNVSRQSKSLLGVKESKEEMSASKATKITDKRSSVLSSDRKERSPAGLTLKRGIHHKPELSIVQKYKNMHYTDRYKMRTTTLAGSTSNKPRSLIKATQEIAEQDKLRSKDEGKSRTDINKKVYRENSGGLKHRGSSYHAGSEHRTRTEIVDKSKTLSSRLSSRLGDNVRRESYQDSKLITKSDLSNKEDAYNAKSRTSMEARKLTNSAMRAARYKEMQMERKVDDYHDKYASSSNHAMQLDSPKKRHLSPAPQSLSSSKFSSTTSHDDHKRRRVASPSPLQRVNSRISADKWRSNDSSLRAREATSPERHGLSKWSNKSSITQYEAQDGNNKLIYGSRLTEQQHESRYNHGSSNQAMRSSPTIYSPPASHDEQLQQRLASRSGGSDSDYVRKVFVGSSDNKGDTRYVGQQQPSVQSVNFNNYTANRVGNAGGSNQMVAAPPANPGYGNTFRFPSPVAPYQPSQSLPGSSNDQYGPMRYNYPNSGHPPSVYNSPAVMDPNMLLRPPPSHGTAAMFLGGGGPTNHAPIAPQFMPPPQMYRPPVNNSFPNAAPHNSRQASFNVTSGGGSGGGFQGGYMPASMPPNPVGSFGVARPVTLNPFIHQSAPVAAIPHDQQNQHLDSYSGGNVSAVGKNSGGNFNYKQNAHQNRF